MVKKTIDFFSSLKIPISVLFITGVSLISNKVGYYDRELNILKTRIFSGELVTQALEVEIEHIKQELQRLDKRVSYLEKFKDKH